MEITSEDETQSFCSDKEVSSGADELSDERDYKDSDNKTFAKTSKRKRLGDGTSNNSSEKKKAKVSKPGIIYMSTVPPGMKIKDVRDYYSQFGEVKRSFLQPDQTGWKANVKKRKNITFTEGWIEFKKRRHAKRAVATLNNNPVGGKKAKVYHDFLWNVKYLPGFQWIHLNERLAYERISKKQRELADISAVKREANFFSKSVDLSKKLKRKGIIGQKKQVESVETSRDSNPVQSDAVPKTPVSVNEANGKTPMDRGEFFKLLFARRD